VEGRGQRPKASRWAQGVGVRLYFLIVPVLFVCGIASGWSLGTFTRGLRSKVNIGWRGAKIGAPFFSVKVLLGYLLLGKDLGIPVFFLSARR